MRCQPLEGMATLARRWITPRITSLAALLGMSSCTGYLESSQSRSGSSELPQPGAAGNAAAGAAGSPAVGPSDPNQPTIENPPVLAQISCKPGDDPLGPTPLKRLSKAQYRNAAINVFNLTGGQRLGSEIATDVLTNYALIPEDSKMVPNTGIKTAITGFDKTDSTVSQYHTDGSFFVGLATGASFVKNLAWVKSELQAATSLLKGTEACSMLPPSAGCIRNFIAGFGRRALRRPLTQAELDDYVSMYQELGAGDYLAGLSGVITRFFMSPQFLYQVEVEGTPVDGRSDLLSLTSYELASRLSLALHDDIPDAALDSAAEDGSLMTDEGYAKQLERLFNGGSERTQDILRTNVSGDSLNETTAYQSSYTPVQIVIDNFFNQWLKVYSNKSFEYSNLNLQALADRDHPTYLSAGQHHQHFNALQQEVINLYSYYTWKTPGTFADLMTTAKLAYTGTDPALLLDEPSWGAGGAEPPFWNALSAPPMPSYPAGQRDGLLNRAFFLMSGNETTNPVRRGVFVQRQILCNLLPSPDPNALPDRALETPEAHPDATTRGRFAAKTAPGLCQTCHAIINPTGFAFENYDSLGRSRGEELVFGANHEVVGSPRIDSSSSVVLDGVAVEVKNGSELMHAVAGSKLANECFARQYFRFVFGRTETEGDGCLLSDLYQASTTNGMLDMFHRVAKTPGFKLHRVGPQ